MTSTNDVLQNHLDCFARRDLAGILADYAPDAVLFTPEGSLRGEAAIRPLFESMLAEFGKPGAEFRMRQRIVDGDHAFIVWTARTADRNYELGTDTFVIRDGKIILQSFASKTTPSA